MIVMQIAKTKRIIIGSLVLFLAISLTYSYAQQTREYSEADNTIEAEVGDNIVITLEANQASDLKWRLTEPLAQNILQLIDVRYVLGMARFHGAGGKEIWTIQALSAGKTAISLEYVIPRENNPVPRKQKTFEVTIIESSAPKQPQ